MKKILGTLACFTFLVSSVSGGTGSGTVAPRLPTCLQDQYGNQYDHLATDPSHGIVTGVVTNAEGCPGPWTMVGSWTVNSSGQVILELTSANNGSDGCVPIYKLKGPYPRSNWFYMDGLRNDQAFKYAACSATSTVVPDEGVGGAHGMKR